MSEIMTATRKGRFELFFGCLRCFQFVQFFLNPADLFLLVGQLERSIPFVPGFIVSLGFEVEVPEMVVD